jgi:hypothetical protein
MASNNLEIGYKNINWAFTNSKEDEGGREGWVGWKEGTFETLFL